jgi:hypothetical protein
MEDTFKIKKPDGALLFLSLQEFAAFCKQFQHENPSLEIEAEPESFPCIGFPVYTAYESDRKDKRVFAFVHLYMDEFDKNALYAKSEWGPLDRFESALLMS